jgi:arginase
MRIRLISVPYDTAQREARMGLGPGCFLRHGAVERLQALGHDVVTAIIDARSEFPAEVATAFEIMRLLAREVRDAVAMDEFPLILAGNCNTSVGTVSGLSPRRTGVVWFDGHADFDTPDSSSSGFIDGMGLAILTGHCWRAIARSIPDYEPVAENHVVLAGASDIESLERSRLTQSQITYLSDEILNSDDGDHRLGTVLDRIGGEVSGVYLHVDLDVQDARIAPANHFRPPGGLTPQRLRDLIRTTHRKSKILAAAVTAYDPSVDPAGVTLESGLAVIEAIAGGE